MVVSQWNAHDVVCSFWFATQCCSKEKDKKELQQGVAHLKKEKGEGEEVENVAPAYFLF